MEENKELKQEECCPENNGTEIKCEKHENSDNKKDFVKGHLGVLSVLCNVVAIVFMIISYMLLWTINGNTNDARCVFNWLAGIMLLAGLTCFVLNMIKNRKLSLTADFVFECVAILAFLI